MLTTSSKLMRLIMTSPSYHYHIGRYCLPAERPSEPIRHSSQTVNQPHQQASQWPQRWQPITDQDFKIIRRHDEHKQDHPTTRIHTNRRKSAVLEQELKTLQGEVP